MPDTPQERREEHEVRWRCGRGPDHPGPPLRLVRGRGLV